MVDRRQVSGRRKEDRITRRWSVIRTMWREGVPALAIGIAAWSVVLAQGTVHDLEREGDVRAQGQCTIFEGQHLDDVQTLSRTYAYFLTIDPEDRDDAIFRFAVRQLPQVEARAYADPAPEYCDELTDDGDEIGLAEPDPVVPDRPKGLTDTLRLPPQPRR